MLMWSVFYKRVACSEYICCSWVKCMVTHLKHFLFFCIDCILCVCMHEPYAKFWVVSYVMRVVVVFSASTSFDKIPVLF